MPRSSRRQLRELRHRRAQRGGLGFSDHLIKPVGVLLLLCAILIGGAAFFTNQSVLSSSPDTNRDSLDTRQPRQYSELTESRLQNEVPGTFVTSQQSPPEKFSSGPQTESLEELLDSTLDKTHSLPLATYYALLRKAHSVNAIELQKSARTNIGYAHLVPEPKKYRGELIALKGVAHRIREFEPPKNRDGFTKLYEAWLSTAESATNPYVVIFSELPEGMTIGETMHEEVSFEGYFFKLWAYQAQDAPRFAPLLLGRRLTWYPEPPPVEALPASTVIAISASIAVILLIALVLVFRFDRNRSKPILPENISNNELAERAGPTIDEFLEDYSPPEESP